MKKVLEQFIDYEYKNKIKDEDIVYNEYALSTPHCNEAQLKIDCWNRKYYVCRHYR